MKVIPAALLKSEQAKILLAGDGLYVIVKELGESVYERETFLGQPAISIVLQGKQQIATDHNPTLTASFGKGLILPAGIYVVSDLLPERGVFQVMLFYFTQALIQEFLKEKDIELEKLAPNRRPFLFSCGPIVQEWVADQLRFLRRLPTESGPMVKWKTLELLQLLSYQGSPQLLEHLISLSLPHGRNFRTFMENNFHKVLRVEHFAQLTGRSVSTFRRDFQVVFSATPNRWLRQKRLELAKSLLIGQDLPIADLAHRVGYANTSYFIQAFKDFTGFSPRQFQKVKKDQS